MNKLVIVISAITVAIATWSLYLLMNIPDEMQGIRKQIEKLQLSQKKEQTYLDDDNPLQAIELKTIADIDKRREQAGTNVETISFAKMVAEVDEWLFVPEAEQQAIKKIEEMTQELRERINGEVASLLKAARESPNGMTAAEKMSKINLLLALYPSPVTDDQRKKLNELTEDILTTSKRVEELQRLRYSQWAIEQIKNELWQHRQLNKISSLSNLKNMALGRDKIAMLNNCINLLKEIDTALLEPSALDLYNHAYGLTKDALGGDDDRLIKLAKGLSSPETPRKKLSDF